MLRNGRHDNDHDPLVKGWAGDMTPRDAFEDHADRLWRLRRTDPALSTR